MFNRVHRFIKNITFNSGLNRDKFINNKKIVNKIINKNKNKNMIIVRKMSTYANPSGNNNNDNNNNNNKNFLYMFVMALGVYISHNFDKNRKN
jgi:hypothetical protein